MLTGLDSALSGSTGRTEGRLEPRQAEPKRGEDRRRSGLQGLTLRVGGDGQARQRRSPKTELASRSRAYTWTPLRASVCTCQSH